MSRCPRCGKEKRHDGICSECKSEFVVAVQRVRDSWEYSEPRIRSHSQERDYRQLRQEGYNILLYSLLDALRLPRYVEGRRTKTRLVSSSEWRSVADAVTQNRSTLNSNGFIQDRFGFLVDAGYLAPAGYSEFSPEDELYLLSEREPYCEI